MKIALAIIISLSFTLGVGAEDQCAEEKSKKSNPRSFFGDTYPLSTPGPEQSRFKPYGTNSLIWQTTTDDQSAAEARYSFLYTVFDCRPLLESEQKWFNCNKKSYFKPSVFLSYTGEFDFYMGTRPSGPVINRLNNPAIHLYVRLGEDNSEGTYDSPYKIRFFDISLEHRSNGQATDVKEMQGNDLKTVLNYGINNYEYFDSLSRESNFLSLTFGTYNKYDFNWKVGAKVFTSQESLINWGPMANTGVSFQDYDIINISLDKTWWKNENEPSFGIKAEYTFGKEGFDTDSIEIMAIKHIYSLPVMFKVHFGPFEHLSNYTKSVTSWGIGLAFMY